MCTPFKHIIKKKHLQALILFCMCFICTFRIFLLQSFRNDVFAQAITGHLEQIPDIKRGKTNIFFLETSCIIGTSNQALLSVRQACAIESAAKANPEYKIYLLHLCEYKRPVAPVTEDYISQVFTYPNVQFYKLDAKQLVKGTPIEQWWLAGSLANSSYPVEHASDVLRLVALWKFGGIYMDLDFVVLSPFDGRSNFVGAESSTTLANGMMSFDEDGIGHKIVTKMLKELQSTFNGSEWASIGPKLLTTVLKKKCQFSEVQMMTKMTTDYCTGFTVFPPQMFYPIPWAFWVLFFAKTDPNTNFPLSEMHKSIAVHLWNRFSKVLNVTVGSDVVYDVLAHDQCPKVYRNCGLQF